MVTLIHLVTVTQNCMKALVHSILSMRFAAAAAAANSKVAIIFFFMNYICRLFWDVSYNI